MRTTSRILLLGLCLLHSASAQTDLCSQYSDNCNDCNYLPDGSSRPNCGWCQHPASGGTDTRCIDITQRFICPDGAAFTHVCKPGWACDTANPGSCKKTSAGEGFPDEATCDKACAVTPTFKCNTTDYQCIQCSETSWDPTCSQSKVTACSNCNQDPATDPCMSLGSCPVCAGIVVQGVTCGWCPGSLIGNDGNPLAYHCGGQIGAHSYFQSCSGSGTLAR